MPKTLTVPEGLFSDDTFFLSQKNPIATVDQRDLEAQALEMMDTPPIIEARAMAEQRFKILAGPHISEEALLGIEEKMEEWTFHYLILALNSDSHYPKVLGNGYGPPHEWFGMKVPGCRGYGTGENPDNNYSFVPLDGRSRFELYGKVQDPPIGDCPFYVTRCLSQALNVTGLDWRDIDIAEDGTFVITIDPEPANGRRNHLQTSVDSVYLFIRDGRENWDQVPNAYRVRRLDPPATPPMTRQQQAELARRMIIDDVPTNFFFKAMVQILEPNTVTQPSASSNWGGMPLQRLVRGRVVIEDDEAFVLTITSGDAGYWVLTRYDSWLMTGNFWDKTTTLNNTQTIPNPDGSYTVVISLQDPGVHNWVDTEGLHEVLLLQRWQLLPQSADGFGGVMGEPTMAGELVKLADLKGVLPETTTWVTSEQRRQQLSDRKTQFLRRFEI